MKTTVYKEEYGVNLSNLTFKYPIYIKNPETKNRNKSY